MDSWVLSDHLPECQLCKRALNETIYVNTDIIDSDNQDETPNIKFDNEKEKISLNHHSFSSNFGANHTYRTQITRAPDLYRINSQYPYVYTNNENAHQRMMSARSNDDEVRQRMTSARFDDDDEDRHILNTIIESSGRPTLTPRLRLDDDDDVNVYHNTSRSTFNDDFRGSRMEEVD